MLRIGLSFRIPTAYKFLLFTFIFMSSTSFSQQTVIQMGAGSNNQTFSTCNGFLIDSGGQGGPGYSNGEDVTITLCPDTPGDQITVTFNTFALSMTDDNPAPNVQNVDYMYVYDGTSTAAGTLGTYKNNELLGVVIQATPLNATGCITLRFTSNSAGTGMFSASVSCSTPCDDPVAAGQIVGGITPDSIRVCVGELVSFQDLGSFAQPGFNIANYSWDFMDGTTATGANVSHAFSVPGLYKVQLFVQDDNQDNECVNNNLLDLQVLVGTIPDMSSFPSDTTLCLGESLTVTATPDAYEVLWDGFPNSNTIDDGCLTDNQLGVAQNVDLLQTGFAAGTTITNINQIESICLELEHSFMGDLVISVFCPNGQSVILHQQGGGGTQIGEPNQLDNVDCNDPTTLGTPYNYCFTPTATDTWVEWVAAQSGWSLTIPAGDYEPVQPLSNLIGCPTNGVWTISVVDNWAADDGTLFSFALNLDPSLYPPISTFQPDIGSGADSSYWHMPATDVTNLSPDADVISIDPQAPGTYNYIYTVIDDFGCQYDTTYTVVVNPDPVTFAGNDTTLCDGNILQLNGLVNGFDANTACDYTLTLNSDWGGWSGCDVTVSYGTTTNTYTLTTETTASYPLSITNGTPVSVTFNVNTGFPWGIDYTVTDPSGNVLVNGNNLPWSGSLTNNFTANCVGDYTYSWTPPTNLSDPTILNPDCTASSTQTYQLTIYPTGHPLCATTDDIVISTSISPEAGNDTTITICDGTPAFDLYTVLTGADPGGTWTNQMGQTVTMPFDPSVNTAGNYKYTVNNNGCFDFSVVTVQIISTTITNQLATNVSCNSANDGIIAITGTNFNKYSLNGGAQISCTSPLTISNLAPGSYTVDLFGPDGCSESADFTITEPAPLQLTSISDDEMICPGEDVSLNATGTGGSSQLIYTWQENGVTVGTGQTITVSPTAPTTQYCVILSEQCGSPEDTLCMTVDLAPDIIPALDPDTTNGCKPLTVHFSNITQNSADIQSIKVDFGDGTIVNYLPNQPIIHQYTQLGLYTVKVDVVSVHGCSYSTTYTNWIETFSLPVASFIINPNPVSVFDPTTTLLNTSSLDVTSFTWNMPGGMPSYSVQESVNVRYPIDVLANYPVTLTVVNDHQCVDSITNYVIVQNEILLYAPNTFTPDGDQFNQTWGVHISGIDIYEFTLRIYNRWGQIVWESNDASIAWDGTYNGKIVPNGTYTWTIEAGDVQTDEKYRFNGHLSILK